MKFSVTASIPEQYHKFFDKIPKDKSIDFDTQDEKHEYVLREYAYCLKQIKAYEMAFDLKDRAKTKVDLYERQVSFMNSVKQQRKVSTQPKEMA